MEIRYLEAFLTIAEEGSISKAATRLHLTQPAVSRQLKQMETSLQGRLFTRSHEGMALTDKGQKLYADVRPLWSSLRSRLLAYMPSPVVRLGLTPFLSPLYLPDSITYATSTVAVECHQTRLNCLEFIPMLEKGEIDAAVIEDLPHHQGLYSTLIKHDHYKVAMSDDHPLAIYNELSLEQCIDYPQIVPPKKSRFYQFWVALRDQNNWTKHDVFSVPYQSLLYSVKQKNGVAFIPQLMLEPVWHSGIVYKPIKDPNFARHLYLYTSDKHYLKPLQQSFANVIIQ